jgi:hypothetical protein
MPLPTPEAASSPFSPSSFLRSLQSNSLSLTDPNSAAAERFCLYVMAEREMPDILQSQIPNPKSLSCHVKSTHHVPGRPSLLFILERLLGPAFHLRPLQPRGILASCHHGRPHLPLFRHFLGLAAGKRDRGSGIVPVLISCSLPWSNWLWLHSTMKGGEAGQKEGWEEASRQL